MMEARGVMAARQPGASGEPGEQQNDRCQNDGGYDCGVQDH